MFNCICFFFGRVQPFSSEPISSISNIHCSLVKPSFLLVKPHMCHLMVLNHTVFTIFAIFCWLKYDSVHTYSPLIRLFPFNFSSPLSSKSLTYSKIWAFSKEKSQGLPSSPSLASVVVRWALFLAEPGVIANIMYYIISIWYIANGVCKTSITGGKQWLSGSVEW